MNEYQKGSINLELSLKIINSYERANPKKYLSDWNYFLNDSKLQDFYNPDRKTIFVSTMHKVKGKEFDAVWIMLDRYSARQDEKKRVLYVAITRAKESLYIHCNIALFEKLAVIQGTSVSYRKDNNSYPEPKIIAMQAALNDMYLDHFKSKEIQARIKNLKSGDLLFMNNFLEVFTKKEDNVILAKFSVKFQNSIKGYFAKGFRISTVICGYIITRQDSENKIYRLILPYLELKKVDED